MHRALPAPAVTVVDTTGAGDVVCGALAAELARGAALPEPAATAVAAGAFAVTALGARGARGALPRPADLCPGTSRGQHPCTAEGVRAEQARTPSAHTATGAPCRPGSSHC
ncbi:PfkB family carbohydrate kinase [Kitasatospora sp. NPDC048722]|uniref:PfkB family carbohydrate kinase n=1 Tax=Kitasatospora sp. NPDC048722 TaxID=3155639 RepID=UPI0033EC725B